MDFEEFCAAAVSVYQLEGLDRWEQRARCAYELFEKDGNRAIMIEELASVFSCQFNSLLCDWQQLLIFGLCFRYLALGFDRGK